MDKSEINRLVAEKVMGWTVYEEDSHGIIWAMDNGYGKKDWNPAENISDAWMVVEELIEIGEIVSCSLAYDDSTKEWKLAIRKYDEILNWDYWPNAESASMAICLAALEAVK